MCTDIQKQIYNEFLKETRGARNLPYRRRKDFQTLNETLKLCLLRLEKLFLKNKEIRPCDFFKAPYNVYPEGENFDLKFYTSQKAIKVYKIYIESKKYIDQSKISDNIASSSESSEIN